MVLPFGVSASDFSVEAKNISRFAGEPSDFFAEISEGGLHFEFSFPLVPAVKFYEINVGCSPAKRLIFLASTLNSDAKTPICSTINSLD